MWRTVASGLHGRAPLALLAACLVILSACGARGATSSVVGAASSTPIPTPAAPPASALAWTPIQLPATQPSALSGGFQAQGPTLGLAQSDSATAYVCVAAADSSHTRVSTWVTRDRGATWQAGADIIASTGSPIEVTGCQIIVDSEQATTAVAQVGYLPAGGCVPAVDCVDYVLYLTTDAGRHWTTFKGPQQTLAEMATRGQLTYALFRSPPRSASMPAMTFVVSSDNRRTWKPVPGVASDTTAPVPELGGARVYNFWLNPISGALLVMTSDGGIDQQTFLTSTDGGDHWTTLAAPPFPIETYDIVVQQPFTAQPWRICGGAPYSETIRGVQQNKHMDELACTLDSGAHWVTYHLDVPTRPDSGTPEYTLVGIADDGAVLLTTPAGLARYTDGSPSMQALGPAPNGGFTQYAAGQGAGVLWSAPVGGYANPDPQQHIFTASYA